jgi:hypothetical protein
MSTREETLEVLLQELRTWDKGALNNLNQKWRNLHGYECANASLQELAETLAEIRKLT